MTPRPWPRPTSASPSAPGTDVAVETADIVLVKSNPLDAVAILGLARATYRKMVQNLAWATGYNAFAIPLAAGVSIPIRHPPEPRHGCFLNVPEHRHRCHQFEILEVAELNSHDAIDTDRRPRLS